MSNVSDQCRQLYVQQCQMIASTKKEDVQKVGSLGLAFCAPLVALKVAPSAVVLAGVVAVGYAGLVVGKSLGAQVHDHCTKVAEANLQLQLPQ